MKKCAYLCIFAGVVSLFGMKSSIFEEEKVLHQDNLFTRLQSAKMIEEQYLKAEEAFEHEKKCTELISDVEFVHFVFSQDEYIIPYFYDLLKVILRRCEGDIVQAKEIVCNIIAHKKSMVGDMKVWSLMKRMMEGIPMDGNISVVFESIECMHRLLDQPDVFHKLSNFIAYIDRNFEPEDYIMVNCIFPFFVQCPFFEAMRALAPDFDALKFGFLAIRSFCKATPYNFSRKKILKLSDSFLSQFFTIAQGKPSVLEYASEAIPALFVLKEQGMSYDKASEAVLVLLDEDIEKVMTLGEFIGFDASLPIEGKPEVSEKEYSPLKMSLMLIANDVNRDPYVRRLFQIARKRFDEVVFGKADFENFAMSIFDSLFHALLKSTSSKNALDCIHAAMLLLDDSIIPNNDSLIYEEGIENDPWKEILGSLSEGTPPTDEEMAESLEGIIVERENLFVCDYEIIAEIIIKLRELRYELSLEIFIEFYPQLSGFVFKIKEIFSEPIAYHLKWLGRAYEQIGQHSLEEAKAIYAESRNKK